MRNLLERAIALQGQRIAETGAAEAELKVLRPEDMTDPPGRKDDGGSGLYL